LLWEKSRLIRHKLRPPAEPQFFARDLSRISPAETAHLPKKKDGTLNTYGLGLAAKHSVHFTLEELSRAFQQCADANQRLISSQGSESVILTRLLVGFLQRARD